MLPEVGDLLVPARLGDVPFLDVRDIVITVVAAVDGVAFDIPGPSRGGFVACVDFKLLADVGTVVVDMGLTVGDHGIHYTEWHCRTSGICQLEQCVTGAQMGDGQARTGANVCH